MLNKTTPGLQRALPPDLYRKASAFEAERKAVFSKSWRLIGHENMIPEPGDYISDDIAGTPIIAVRNNDGAINVFHNVCRHRAGPLITDEAGNCGQALTCKYHGWRYALDGRLRNARDFGVTEGFDPREFSLYPVKSAIWRGFIFASLSDDAPGLQTLLAPVEKGLGDGAVPPFAFRRTHEIACNWKTYVENYLEGYHVPDIHPGLDAEIDASAYRVEMDGEVAVHLAPSKADDAVYTGYWAWVWPWLGVNVYQHGLMMERISPVSPVLTRLDYLYFFDPDRRDELDTMINLSDEVTGEDKVICEQVQRNLGAGVYGPGPLSPKHENAVGWFQNRMREQAGY